MSGIGGELDFPPGSPGVFEGDLSYEELPDLENLSDNELGSADERDYDEETCEDYPEGFSSPQEYNADVVSPAGCQGGFDDQSDVEDESVEESRGRDEEEYFSDDSRGTGRFDVTDGQANDENSHDGFSQDEDRVMRKGGERHVTFSSVTEEIPNSGDEDDVSLNGDEEDNVSLNGDHENHGSVDAYVDDDVSVDGDEVDQDSVIGDEEDNVSMNGDNEDNASVNGDEEDNVSVCGEDELDSRADESEIIDGRHGGVTNRRHVGDERSSDGLSQEREDIRRGRRDFSIFSGEVRARTYEAMGSSLGQKIRVARGNRSHVREKDRRMEGSGHQRRYRVGTCANRAEVPPDSENEDEAMDEGGAGREVNNGSQEEQALTGDGEKSGAEDESQEEENGGEEDGSYKGEDDSDEENEDDERDEEKEGDERDKENKDDESNEDDEDDEREEEDEEVEANGEKQDVEDKGKHPAEDPEFKAWRERNKHRFELLDVDFEDDSTENCENHESSKELEDSEDVEVRSVWKASVEAPVEVTWSSEFEVETDALGRDYAIGVDSEDEGTVSGDETDTDGESRTRPKASTKADSGSSAVEEEPKEEEIDYERVLEEDFPLLEQKLAKLARFSKKRGELTSKLLMESDFVIADVKKLTSLVKENESLLDRRLEAEHARIFEEVQSLETGYEVIRDLEKVAQEIVLKYGGKNNRTVAEVDMTMAMQEAEIASRIASIEKNSSILHLYRSQAERDGECLAELQKLADLELNRDVQMAESHPDLASGYRCANWQLTRLCAEAELVGLRKESAEIDQELADAEKELAEDDEEDGSTEAQALEQQYRSLELNLKERESKLTAMNEAAAAFESDLMIDKNDLVRVELDVREEFVDVAVREILLQIVDKNGDLSFFGIEEPPEDCREFDLKEEELRTFSELESRVDNLERLVDALLPLLEPKEIEEEIDPELEAKRKEMEAALVKLEETKAAVASIVAETSAARTRSEELRTKLMGLFGAMMASGDSREAETEESSPAAEELMEQKLASLGRQKAQLLHEQVERKVKLDELRQELAQVHARAEKERAELKEKFDELDAKCQRVVDKINDLIQFLDSAEENSEKEETEIAQLVKEIEFMEDCASVGAVEALEAAEDKKLKEKQSAIETVKKEAAERLATLQKVMSDLEAIHAENASLEAEIKEDEKKIEGKTRDRPLGSDPEAVVVQLKEAQAVAFKIVEIQNEKAVVERDVKALEEELVEEHKEDGLEIENLEELLKTLDQENEDSEEESDHQEEESDYEKEESDYEEEVSDHEEEVSDHEEDASSDREENDDDSEGALMIVESGDEDSEGGLKIVESDDDVEREEPENENPEKESENAKDGSANQSENEGPGEEVENEEPVDKLEDKEAHQVMQGEEPRNEVQNKRPTKAPQKEESEDEIEAIRRFLASEYIPSPRVSPVPYTDGDPFESPVLRASGPVADRAGRRNSKKTRGPTALESDSSDLFSGKPFQ